jgi:hypothetical protein
MSDVKKGFNITVGVVLALIFAFVILPTGACVGCMVLGAGSAGVAEANRQVEQEKLGPEIEFSGLDFKVIPKGQTISDVAYKFTVVNNRDTELTKSFGVKFLDAEGFPVVEDTLLFETIPARSRRVVTGARLVKNHLAEAAQSMNVEEK